MVHTVSPPPGALLFDLDGTLVESDSLHRAVFAEMFAARGRPFDAAFYAAEIQGRHNTDLFAEHFPGEDGVALAAHKEATFRARLPGDWAAMPGVAGVLARARAAGWALAVVTNAPRANADAMLRALGLHAAFDTVVLAEDCSRPKPDPAPYRAAMQRLGVDPSVCVAFEDSRSGLAAAVASGAATIGIATALAPADLAAAGAALAVADFTDPALDAFLARRGLPPA